MEETSDLSFVFDSTNYQWTKDSEANEMFLRSSEIYFNERLRRVGHVFLNEVRDHLGVSRIPAGQRLGWLLRAGEDAHIELERTEKEGAFLIEPKGLKEIWEDI